MTHGTESFNQVDAERLLEAVSRMGHIRVQALDERRYHVRVVGDSQPVFRVVEALEVFDFSLNVVKIQGPSAYINLLARGKIVRVSPNEECKVWPAAAAQPQPQDPGAAEPSRAHYPPPPTPPVAQPAPTPPLVQTPLHAPATTAAPVAPASTAGEAQGDGSQSQGDGGQAPA